MDKVLNYSLVLIIATVMATGVFSIRDLSDGRVLTVVQQLTK